jgi:DNA repair protein RecO (recombination protein O)
MPGLYRDECVVLKTIKLGEADRIVTVYTRLHGKVRAVAKGVRRTKSRFGGRLEPFTHLDLMLYRGRELDTVTQVHVLEPFRVLREDLARLTGAAAIAELIDKVAPDNERSQPLYALLLDGLRALAARPPATVIPAFMVKVLSLSGYHPQLSACAACGATSGFGGFSAASGGAVCEDCRREDNTSVRVPFDRIALMARLLRNGFGEQADPEAAGDVTRLLKAYAEYHLERPLRSLALLQ